MKTKTYKKNPDARTEKYNAIFSKKESALIMKFRKDAERKNKNTVTKSTAVWLLVRQGLADCGYID